jgi:magnesium-transporting ATPase (P-type)
VGDILKVEDTHKFAADMVILSTSASTGKFFVMTANLDGETNLKPMSAARLTKHCRVSHTGRKLNIWWRYATLFDLFLLVHDTDMKRHITL